LAVSCITVGLDDKCFFIWAWQAQKTTPHTQMGRGRPNSWSKNGQGRPKPPKGAEQAQIPKRGRAGLMD